MDMIHSLKHFAEAARIGSLSAAARELGISPATMSRSIDSLERQLGINLLAKTSRSLGLTEAGEVYLPRVESILKELAEATALAQGVHSEPRGDLRVHSRVAVGNICLAPLVPKFLKQYPDINLNFTTSNEVSLPLLKNNIDVDIRTGVLQDSSLIARKLADSHRLLVASPEYLAEHGTPRVPTDLAQHNCIMFRKDAGPILWRLRDRDGQEHTVAPASNFETNSGSLIRQALRNHVGIAQMTNWAVRDDLLSGRLVSVLPDFEVTQDDFQHGIYAVFMPSRSQCRKVRVFLDFLVENFRCSDQFLMTKAAA
ncbi:MAG: LysR family transcriptional regulator [Proteobacteria bacterium]|nr:LysR family transcriptional regulator [Pseudomonadota bacterium]